MNADAFRQLYNYHFSENQKVWELVAGLSEEDFTKSVDYGIGSIQNHIIHLINVDNWWFSDLRGTLSVDDLTPTTDYIKIRAQWDSVEQHMRDYLNTITDDMLFQKPIAEGEDADLLLWQILLHVANHGTDHRAQMLRLLREAGATTIAQDFIFFAYDNLT